VTAFKDLADYILAPLHGRAEEAWHAAPPGKWSPAEIVDHLATAMENSAKGFASRADKPPMTRRPLGMPQRVAQAVVLRMGWFPGRRVAPETTRPQAHPDRAATEAKLRRAVDAFLELERTLLPARATDLFLKHPVLGDLTFAEFMCFHVRHAEHHRKQMVERLGT
jgi:hypothetical protein